MDIDVLPAVEHGEPKTLCIKYEDGSVLRVPYIDRRGAMSFLALEDDAVGYWIESYKGG